MGATLKNRRTVVRGLWGVAAVLLVGGAMLLVWLPSLVRGRVADAVKERLGLQATVDDVSVGMSGVQLTGVRLVSPKGDGVLVQVVSMRLRANPFAVLASGSSAVSGLDIDGADLSVDRASPEVAELLERARAGTREQVTNDDAAARPGREAHGRRIAITIRDGKTELLRCAGLQIDSDGIRMQGTVQSLHVQHERTAARLERLTFAAQRASGWKLSKLDVERAELLFEQAPAPQAMPADTEDEEPAATAPAGQPKRRAPDASPAAAPVVPVVSAGPAQPVPVAGPGANDADSPWGRIMARLIPGAQLTLRDAVLSQRAGTTRVTILQSAHVELEAKSAQEARVLVRGAADGGGHLEIDLRVWPTDLRADGKIVLKSLPLTLVSPLLPQVPWYEPQHSRIDAELSVRAESLARVALSGRAVLAKAAIFSPRIAPLPVRDITVSLEGKGAWLPVQRRLEVSEGRLGVGKTSVAISGALELDASHYAIELDGALSPTKCTDAVRSIPVDLLADLAVAEWTGSVAGKLRARVDSRDLQKTVLELDVRDQCEFASLPAMADLRRFGEPFVHSVVEPDETVFEMETGPGTDAWTPIEAISPFLIHAVLTHEDPGFFTHEGFSMLHVRNALVRNLEEGRYVVGASTITMQLVKNVFLRREKTLARKLQEVLLTWWLERAMEKRDILELYLNVIEYGPSVYGIRNAARHYFNRLPSELSPAEAVFLSTILPSPKRYHSFFERGALTPTWQALMRKQLQRMQQRGVYSTEAITYGLAEIDAFKFVPEGTAAAPRIIPGDAAALPFEARGPAISDFEADGGESFDAPADGYD